MKRLCFRRHHSQLSSLRFREAARGKSTPNGLRLQIWFGSSAGKVLRFSLVGGGVNIVGFGGPAEDRGPPVGRGWGFATVKVGAAVGGGGTGTDAGGGESEEIGGHCRERGSEKWFVEREGKGKWWRCFLSGDLKKREKVGRDKNGHVGVWASMTCGVEVCFILHFYRLFRLHGFVAAPNK